MDQEILAELKTKMQKALAVVADDLATIRTGRATPALVENVVVSTYEGTQNLKIKELATITTDGPKMLLVSPFDPSTIRDVERGINGANLGFTAAVDGNMIRISIPSLTAERREEYIKLAHGKLEGGRVMLRQIRHEFINDVKKKAEAKEISEDDKKRLEKEIQDVVDKMTAEIESMREKKEQELREI